MLARMARNAGVPDLALEESIRHEEDLLKKLFKPTIVEEQKPAPVEVLAEDKLFTPEPDVSLIQQAVEAIHAPKEQPPALQERLRDAEILGIRKQIAELIAKMGTLSWGGGGTGVVRFHDLDDSTTILARMDSKVYTFLQDTPPLLANGADQWINTASGLEYTNINEGMMVIPTWVEFGPALTQNVADPEPVWFNYPFTAVTADNYAAANSDFYIGVNYDGNVAITLPTQPEVANGHTFVIKDESGNASGATNWIDIYASGTDKIDGQDFVRLQIDHGSLTFFYRGGWRII